MTIRFLNPLLRPSSAACCLLLCLGIGAALPAQASRHTTQVTPVEMRIKLLEYDAADGNANAQLMLAQLYLKGVPGVTYNPHRGLFWLERAAESGKPELQEHLGEVFHFGTYGIRDLDKALYWYQKAADNGLGSAMDYIGLFHSAGLGGLQQDCNKALQWYDKALEAGYSRAKGNIIWILATCPQQELRDGQKALKLAREVIDSKTHREAGDLDNLAAAYAQSNDFEAAITTQLEALSLLDSRSQQLRYNNFLKRLNLYIQNRTWRGPEDEPTQ